MGIYWIPEKEAEKTYLWVDYRHYMGPQFGRILANKSVYVLFIVSRGIGRFYGRILAVATPPTHHDFMPTSLDLLTGHPNPLP
jgi:hypothetical protein